MSNVIRTYRPADLDKIVALINAADTFDGTEDGTSIEEKRAFLLAPMLVPEENAFVCETKDGHIVGYGFVRLLQGEATVFRTRLQIHPSHRGRGLEEQMLRHLYHRAEQRIDEAASRVVDFTCSADAPEGDLIAAMERFGMHETRRFWLMVRPNPSDVAAARYPKGIVTRPYRVPEDNEMVHQTDVEVFRDHWGYADQPLEMWEHYMAQPFVRPSLSIIAEDAATGEIAGFCMIGINDEENGRLGVKRGWIDILGVQRPYRRQGLGTALLLQGLANLAAASVEQAALGCDSENLTGATRIYERVGFHVDKTRIAFRKRMRD